MANNTNNRNSRKKPVSQKRVAIVLASLVGTLTFSSALLLVMESGPLGATPPQMVALTPSAVKQAIQPKTPLLTDAWKNIVIYHSGGLPENLSAADLAEGRLKGGDSVVERQARPSGFHFVIGNGRDRGSIDGELQVGSAWLDQKFGAPHPGWQNSRYYNSPSFKNAIGICLQGDLRNKPATEAQLRFLIQLVEELRSKGMGRTIMFQWELAYQNSPAATPAQIEFAREFQRYIKTNADTQLGAN